MATRPPSALRWITALAPMQDVTTLPFMRVITRYGAPDYFFTEYFRVHEHSRLEPHILASITENPSARPVFAQLIGEDQVRLNGEAARKSERLEPGDVIEDVVTERFFDALGVGPNRAATAVYAQGDYIGTAEEYQLSGGEGDAGSERESDADPAAVATAYREHIADALQQVLDYGNNVLGLDLGAFAPPDAVEETDEKILAKIDWNITEWTISNE